MKKLLYKNRLKRGRDRLKRRADYLDEIAKIVEKNKPVQDLIDGLVKIWEPTPLPDDGGK